MHCLEGNCYSETWGAVYSETQLYYDPITMIYSGALPLHLTQKEFRDVGHVDSNRRCPTRTESALPLARGSLRQPCRRRSGSGHSILRVPRGTDMDFEGLYVLTELFAWRFEDCVGKSHECWRNRQAEKSQAEDLEGDG